MYWFQLFALVQRGEGQFRNIVHLYDLPVTDTCLGAKPPQESSTRILATKAMECVDARTEQGRRTVLITDGAKAYPRLCQQFDLQHAFVSHSQGEFSRNQSRGCWPKLQIHTGSVDSIWQNIKDWVPNSLCAQRSGKVNSSLMTYCRQWQWRNAHVLCKDLMATTGKALKR